MKSIFKTLFLVIVGVCLGLIHTESTSIGLSVGGILFLFALNQRHLKKIPIVIAIIFGIQIIGLALTRFVFDFFQGHANSVKYSVGWSSYIGYAKSLEYWVILPLFFSCLVIALITSHWKFQKNEPPPQSIKLFQNRHPWHPWASLICECLIIGLIFSHQIPDIQTWIQHLPFLRHSNEFDSLNLLIWQYSHFKEWLPFKDYWYPYSGQYLQIFTPSLALPIEMIIAYGHRCLILGLFAGCTYFLSHRNLFWTLLAVTLVSVGVESGLIFGEHRYFLSLNLVLLFILMKDNHSYKILLPIFFGLFSAYTLFYEANQLIYAAIPMICLLIMRFIERQKTGHDHSFWISQIRHLLIPAGILGVFIIGQILWFQYHGQWNGVLSFYREMPEMAAYGSRPMDLKTWFSIHPTVDFWKLNTLSDHNIAHHLFLWSILIFPTLGVYLKLRSKGSTQPDFLGEVLIGCGTLAFFLFLTKHMARPSLMTFQLLPYPAFAGLIYLQRSSVYWNRKQWSVFLSLLIFLLVQFSIHDGPFLKQVQWITPINLYEGPLLRCMKNIVTAPSRIRHNFHYLGWSKQDFKPYYKTYFSSQEFEISGENGLQLKNKFQSILNEPVSAPLYVLGDQSYLYILFDRKPAYTSCLYATSPISRQLDIVQWLESVKPQHVIWDPRFTEFDGIPNLVRVPLLFKKIVENYIPESQVENFEILKLRQPHQTVDLIYWSRQLGTSLDLGSIPSLSEIHQIPVCNSQQTTCDDLLQIELPFTTANPHQKIRLNIQAGVHQFEIQFQVSARTQIHRIYLNRLWFWDTLKNLSEKISLSTSMDPNIKLTRYSIQSGAIFLY